MKSRSLKPTARPGFTLVELLTVVAIISLLISILLPSLSRARDQARRARVRAMLYGIDSALEMFYGDFNRYPNSTAGVDPITDSDILSGAHWLARALVGHDYEGVDTDGRMMRPGANPELTSASLENASRVGVYMEGPMFARDDDDSKFYYGGDSCDYVPTGRPVVYDEMFGSPVLYYRANTRARYPFADSSGAAPDTGGPGRYSLQDNFRITGGGSALGWDFAAAGRQHPFGTFGSSGYDWRDIDTVCGDEDGVAGSFTDMLHSETAHEAADRVRAQNAERFILITAGRDGVFGTADDIANFEIGK